MEIDSEDGVGTTAVSCFPLPPMHWVAQRALTTVTLLAIIAPARRA
ncbi:MAG: hypothetical protein BMS9Abin37_3201 [Acidobacteriota bacterium]|nr:MAG: hypothetical protein BMS9Abin37_3201 [Acidobacteriota bacterium]